jgi:molybdopterin-binding protein
MRHTCGVDGYRIAEAADVLGVSADTLRRWVEAGRVAASEGADGRTRIGREDLAALARSLVEAGPEGVSDQARAASVSARNRMRGIVTAVKKDTVMAQVDLVCGPYRMVSLMSAEAAEDLDLVPGVIAIVSVKSTNVVVELA